MRTRLKVLRLTPTALSGFSECQHLTWLELGVARGERRRPGQNDLERALLEYRGRAHEARLLELYRQQGLCIVELSSAPAANAAAQERALAATRAALEGGADVVYQGTLSSGSPASAPGEAPDEWSSAFGAGARAWSGRPDFLIKTPGASRYGDYHYEVVDAKLARHAQARAILQLCVYTEALTHLQGREPERFWIAVGGSLPEGEAEPPIALRAVDYLSYFRRARTRFEAFVSDAALVEPYPEPVEHCDVCRWWKQCEERRRADDHTSLVAGSTRRQRDRLSRAGLRTLAALAVHAPAEAIDGIEAGSLERLREQARLQLSTRTSGQPSYELLLGAEPGSGLERLPAPTPGDLFLDLEGDAYAFGDGLEYLFGLLELGAPSFDWSGRKTAGEPRYRAHFSQNRAEEKRAFEAIIDRIERGRSEFRDLHVFHFGHREADALKKLSCRHATREEAVDRLLREHVLVDLHTVVRQSLRASVESYSLKQLEALYAFERGTDPRRAAFAMQAYGFWLETGEAVAELAEQRELLERYNQEDCLSTWRLRDWLEARRTELEGLTGRLPARPSSPENAVPQKRDRDQDAAHAVDELQAGLPESPELDTPEQRVRRVLSHLVSWHWREAKSGWWEFFRAKELPPSERLEDRQVLAGLSYEGVLRDEKRSHVHRYRFPAQEHAIRRGQGYRDADTDRSVSVLEIGADHLDIKRAKSSKEPHPGALIPPGPLDCKAQEERLLAIARSVARRGLDDASEFVTARALLRRAPPRVGQIPGAPLVNPGEEASAALIRLSLALEPGVLAVQGPPGSGKTHCGAAAIAALLGAGKRVGITANSHQVIVQLLQKSCAVVQASGAKLRAHHIQDVEDAAPEAQPNEQQLFSQGKDYPAIADALRTGSLQLVGGTSFAWSRAQFLDSVDVLVVDEAAQISLANVLALSTAAPRLILLGDPAQLEQPQRGVHPPGADVSALEYLLGDAVTMPADLGVFLPQTRRLHPRICDFTSRVFYEGRLEPLACLERQAIVQDAASDVRAAPELLGSGLRFLPVLHQGNTNRSDEELERIAAIIEQLLGGGFAYCDRDGQSRPLTARDLLVVAPYNAQVSALRYRLERAGREVRVGTVDKFQGREAPLVIYSMTSSSASDAPRGFEFLYSLNRLNVATSRAQALVVLVASPSLASAQCRTDRQMRLVNALCNYLELAPEIA